MTVRKFLTKQIAPLRKAALFGTVLSLTSWVIHFFHPVGAIGVYISLIFFLPAMVAAATEINCPSCGGTFRHVIFHRDGGAFAIPEEVTECPSCGLKLDAELVPKEHP